MLKGKVQLLEAERGHAVVRHAWEREALERKKGEAETELAKVREAHTAEVKWVLDEAASSKGAHDWDLERCDAIKAKLASTCTQVEEMNCRNNSLEAENCAARKGLMRQVEEGNRRYDSLKAENCAAGEGLMQR